MPVEKRKTVASLSHRWCVPLRNKDARKQFMKEFYDMEVVHGTHYIGKNYLHTVEKSVPVSLFVCFKNFHIQSIFQDILDH